MPLAGGRNASGDCCAVPTARSEEPEGAFAPGLMSVAIHLTDLERSLDFYNRILVLGECARDPGEGSLEEVALTYATDVSGAEPTSSGAMLLRSPRQAGAEPLRHGNALSRIALGVPGLKGVVANAGKGGYEVTRPLSLLGTLGFAKGCV